MKLKTRSPFIITQPENLCTSSGSSCASTPLHAIIIKEWRIELDRGAIISVTYFFQHTRHLDRVHTYDPLVENSSDIHLHKMFLVQIDCLIHNVSMYISSYNAYITYQDMIPHKWNQSEI